MKLLAKMPADVPAAEIAKMSRREGARGIIVDSRGRICLMHATKPGYHKLPGGGLEKDETPKEAFVRECLEETGFAVNVTDELGIIEEYRTDISRHQTSFCFIGQANEKEAEPNMEPGEIDKGFQPEWFSTEKALQIMKNQPDRSKRLIVDRDLLILETALRTLSESPHSR